MKFILVLILFTHNAFAAFTPFPPVVLPPDVLVTKGGILSSTGAAQVEILACADDELLIYDVGETNGLKCSPFPSQSPTTTQGDIIVRGAAADERLAAGTSGFLLTANGAGLAPSYQAAPVATTLTTKGDIQVYDTANARLPIGNDGEWLVADSAEATGLKYTDTLQGRLNPVTDGIPYTPTFVGFSTTGLAATYRRIGEMLRVDFSFTSNTHVASLMTMTLPSGLSYSGANNSVVGKFGSSGAPYDGGIAAFNSDLTHVYIYIDDAAFTSGSLGTAIASGAMSGFFEIPIVGWTSGVDAIAQNKKLVEVIASKGLAQGMLNNVYTIVTYTDTKDTHNAFLNGVFTAPHAATYLACPKALFGNAAFNIGNLISSKFVSSIQGDIRNQFEEVQATATRSVHTGKCAAIEMAENETISFQIFQNNGGTRNLIADTTYNSLTINEIPSIPTIAAAIDSQKWVCEKKFLAADNTTIGAMADLTHTVVIGDKYMYNVQAYTDDNTLTSIENSVILGRVYAFGADNIASSGGCFTAVSTVFQLKKANTNVTRGDGTGAETWSEVCKLPDNYICN